MPNYLMHYFIFSPAMYEDSNFSTSSPVLVILYIKKNYSYSSRCEVVSHYGFNLHFPNNVEHLSFHVSNRFL